MKIASIMWNSYIPMLVKANEGVGFELEIFSNRTLEENPAKIEEALSALEEADLILLYRTSDLFWEGIEKRMKSLKNAYLEIEGWMEERAGEGEFQGGAVDIRTALEVEGWGDKMKAVMEKIHNKNDKRYRK